MGHRGKAVNMRSEEDQWKSLQQHTTRGKFVPAKAMARFCRNATNKTGWSTQQILALVEDWVDAGWISTPQTLQRELAEIARGVRTEDAREKNT